MLTRKFRVTTHAIGDLPVISDIETGFTVATIVTTTVATTVTSPIVTGTVATTAMSPVIVETTAVTAVSTITSPVVSVDLGVGLGTVPSSSISVLYTGPSVPTSVAPTATISVGDIGEDSDESEHNLEVSVGDEVSDEADSVTDNSGAVDNTDAVDNVYKLEDVPGSVNADKVEAVDSDVIQVFTILIVK